MEFKSKFKPICKKIWQAFNSWRKKGMWFRLTVLLIIGFAINVERLYTTNHVPLINEFVLIACKAIRIASEPRVTSANLRYLRVQKSRQLQKQLRSEYKAGRLNLNKNELELLNADTLNANYNQLFELAKRAEIIPKDVSLSQTKRAMLDKSLRLTAERFNPEWAEVRKNISTVPPLSLKQLELNFYWLWGAVWAILPLPVIPVLPWFILCFTLGFWGARSKYKYKWILALIIAVAMTLLWIFFSWLMKYNAIPQSYQKYHIYRGKEFGASVYFAILAAIGSVFGKRLYNWTLKRKYDTVVFIVLLLLSGGVLLTPVKFFREYYIHDLYSYLWILPGKYLLFINSTFVPYSLAGGIAVFCYVWFLIYRNYTEKLKKSIWLLSIQFLLSIFIVYKIILLYLMDW